MINLVSEFCSLFHIRPDVFTVSIDAPMITLLERRLVMPLSESTIAISDGLHRHLQEQLQLRAISISVTKTSSNLHPLFGLKPCSVMSSEIFEDFGIECFDEMSKDDWIRSSSWLLLGVPEKNTLCLSTWFAHQQSSRCVCT